jgi:p-hydroxybenzoate 3-monooxygenase
MVEGVGPHMRTQVGIVGAGPAGLLLSHLLHRGGIESVVVEDRSRAYVEGRIRAGVIEHWAREFLIETGVGARMAREGLVHRGINLAFEGKLHFVDFHALTGKDITVYGQHELVKDLVTARLADGADIRFEAGSVSVHDFETERPSIRFTHGGRSETLDCDFIAGCDGFHGVCRPSIPEGVLKIYERVYPYGWLGILSSSPPPAPELIYAYHEQGFALFSMRGPAIARLYLQCDPEDDVANWPDERIWRELKLRLGGAARLTEGRVLQKSITPMRAFVAEPMQYKRLFLAGDAAHIVPPTGAKGMNLAIADVRRLAAALAAFYRTRRTAPIESYTAACLDRVWKAQRFAYWMTRTLHRTSADNDFDMRRQLAELAYVTSSKAAATALAENYAGLPFA